jgi:hypothetical protein
MKFLRGLGMNWGTQNLSHDFYERRDNAPIDPLWRHGRGWLTWGHEDAWPRPTIGVEWKVGKPVHLFGFGINVEHEETPIHASFYCWPFSLYINAETKFANRIARRLVGEKFGAEREIRLVIGRDDETSIRWAVWTPDSEWSSTTPKYRRGWFTPSAFLLGRWEHSKETLSTTPVVVPMPERAYPATVELILRTYRRKRFPFIVKRYRTATVEIPGGIGFPGKGENAWDCGDDALNSLSGPYSRVEEAIGATVAAVFRNRKKYGGSYTFEPSERAA